MDAKAALMENAHIISKYGNILTSELEKKLTKASVLYVYLANLGWQCLRTGQG